MTPSLFLDTATLLLNNLHRLKPEAFGPSGWDVSATLDLLRRGVRESIPKMSASQKGELARLLASRLKGNQSSLWTRFATDQDGVPPHEALEIECMDAGLWFRTGTGARSSSVHTWAQHVQEAAEERRQAVVDRMLADPDRPPIADLVSAFSFKLTGISTPSDWRSSGWAWMIRNTATKTVESLLCQGADPNATDADGRPVLVYAHELETVRSLLRHGADPLNADLPLDERRQAFAALFDLGGPMSRKMAPVLIGYVERSLARWSTNEKNALLETHRLQMAQALIAPAPWFGVERDAWQFRIHHLNAWLGLPVRSLPAVHHEGHRWSLYAHTLWQDLCLPGNQRAMPGTITDVWPQSGQTDGIPDDVWGWMAAFSQGGSSTPAWDEAMGRPANRDAALVGLDRMLAHPQAWQGGFSFLRNLVVERRDGVAGELREAWQTFLPDRVDRALRAAWSAPSNERRVAIDQAAPLLTWLEKQHPGRDPRYPEWLVMAMASRAPGPLASLRKKLQSALDGGWPKAPLSSEIRGALEGLREVAPEAYALWEQADLARSLHKPATLTTTHSRHRL